MKKIYMLLIVITGFLFLLLSSATTEKKYYYAFKEKVFLFPKENTLLIKYTNGVDKAEAEEFIKKEISSGFKGKWHNPQTVEITIGYEEITKALRTKLESNNGVYTCQPFYTLKDGLDMGVTDEVLIRFLPGISEEQKAELIKTFDIEVVKTTKIYQKLKVKKGADALEIANKIYESGLVEFSTPNFISYPELHQVIPNDIYFPKQITCNNTGQTFTDGHSGTNDADIDAPEAWGITTGCSNIVVAVLDEGVTSNHPDLPNSRQVRLNGSNFGDGNANDPSPSGNHNHGNACAGVIAATMNNNQGIAGIAPECKIMPVRIFNSDGSGILPDSLARAIQFAVDNGANILSNSWGYQSSDQNLHPVIVTAINYALNNNCIVIFSTGNTANHTASSNGYVQFPANVNISGVITVGASDRNDSQANYSPTSSLVDVVAPSHRAYPSQITGETLEMWSIDIPENSGYNPYPASSDMPHPPTTGEILPNTGTNNLAYTARFGGTSHSCPVVAGVAALMLSVNPDLSYMDVFDILTSTADKVGGYTYSNSKCNQMGYGRVNAYEALKAVYQISGPSAVCSYGSIFSVSSLPTVDSIIWSTGSNLTVYSGQNTDSITIKATGRSTSWVRVRLVTECGSITLPEKTVWAGLPNAPNNITRFSSNGKKFAINSYYEFYVSPQPGATYFTWNVSGGTITEGQGTSFVLVRTASYPTNFSLSVKAGNGCGESSYFTRTGFVVDEDLPIDAIPPDETTAETDSPENNLQELKQGSIPATYKITIAPNPTCGETTLTIEPNSAVRTFDETDHWNLEVYLGTHQLKTKQTGLLGQRTKLQTAGWKEGVYVVRVKYKDEILTGKLIVKK